MATCQFKPLHHPALVIFFTRPPSRSSCAPVSIQYVLNCFQRLLQFPCLDPVYPFLDTRHDETVRGERKSTMPMLMPMLVLVGVPQNEGAGHETPAFPRARRRPYPSGVSAPLPPLLVRLPPPCSSLAVAPCALCGKERSTTRKSAKKENLPSRTR